jgi:hypothetical protein
LKLGILLVEARTSGSLEVEARSGSAAPPNASVLRGVLRGVMPCARAEGPSAAG